MIWIAEHDDCLRWCFAEGMTGTETADVLNARFQARYTRNSVIGRAHRLGIKTMNPSKARPQRALVDGKKPWEALGISESTWYRRRQRDEGRLTASPPKPRPPRAKPMPKRQQFICEPVTGLRQADVVPLHLSLLDLAQDQCRWPYGDQAFTFCGNPVFACSPYCEAHAALAIGQGTESERRAHRVAA